VIYSEKFETQGLIYRFTATNDQIISFGLVGGSTIKGYAYSPSDLFHTAPKFYDVNLVPNALPVFLRFKDVLLKYVWSQRPWMFQFAASTRRKISIYRWITERLSKEMPSYTNGPHG